MNNLSESTSTSVGADALTKIEQFTKIRHCGESFLQIYNYNFLLASMRCAYTDGLSEFPLKKVSLQCQGEVCQHNMHMIFMNRMACSEISTNWNGQTGKSKLQHDEQVRILLLASSCWNFFSIIKFTEISKEGSAKT